MPLVRRTLFFLPEITSMTLIRPYLSLSPFQRFLPRLALDPIPSNRVPRGAANLFYSDPRNGRVSHGARATSFRNVLSGNRIDSRRRKKGERFIRNELSVSRSPASFVAQHYLFYS